MNLIQGRGGEEEGGRQGIWEGRRREGGGGREGREGKEGGREGGRGEVGGGREGGRGGREGGREGGMTVIHILIGMFNSIPMIHTI